MPITEEQRIARKKWIGGSDVAAIMGLDRFRSPVDVWLDKTGRDDGFKGNEATELGNALEPAILDMAERNHGLITRNVVADKRDIHLLVNMDGVIDASQCYIDAKSSGIVGPAYSEWGEPGTDEVPRGVIVQLHAGTLAYRRDAELSYVAALLGGLGYREYVVPIDNDLLNVIEDFVPSWWDRHVVTDTPPEGEPPSLEVLGRMDRIPAAAVDIDPSLVAAWIRAKDDAKDAKDAADKAKKALIWALGDAELGDAGDQGTITYKEQRSAPSVDTKAMRAAGIYDKYCTQGTHRTLRHKKPK